MFRLNNFKKNIFYTIKFKFGFEYIFFLVMNAILKDIQGEGLSCIPDCR